MNEFDVSVVIPVYNCAKYVKDCVKSILNQDYNDLSKIQVILVDDGSTDKSLKVCNKLKTTITEFTIDVITGENGGVSSARNKGIKAAKGKYIMFIDADDFISKNAIRKLVKFFDKHYDEVDLVTYPMYEYYSETKNRKILQRYKDYFKETTVYDLKENYGAIQPTMNVIIKNYYQYNNLFNEKIFFHEDILFNTEILMQKLKIGYVKEAKYLYRLYGNSTTDYKINPLYSFEQYMYVFERLFEEFTDENNDVPKYIQRIALNGIRFRINQDRLFPYYLEGEDWERAYNRIISLIKKIDDDTIMKYNQMNKYHKMYLINLKNENIKAYDNYNSTFSINNNNHILLLENFIEIVIDRFKVKNAEIKILGFLKSPITQYKTVNLYVNYTDKDKNEYEEELKLTETVSSRIGTNIKVAEFKKFELNVNIKEIKKLRFKVKIGDNTVNTRFYFNTWSPFDSRIASYKIYDKEYRVQFKGNEFLISKPKKKTIRRDFIRNLKRYSKINKRINFYRILAKLQSNANEKIWLYIDRKNVFDNAYIQFKHDIKIKDNIKKYYILDGKIENCKEKFTSEELKSVIQFGSLKHKILYLNSDKILTSFSSLAEYCPLRKNYKYYKDILKYDLIYLQHGILHAKLLRMYAKTVTPIDKFVISSQFEKDNLINNYEYNENDLIETGMPRLDDKVEQGKPENRIIFAPSWRQYLIGKEVNRKREINKEKFKKSKYYEETIKFLQNEKLLKILKEKNIILDYKLHPIFEKYKKCFKNITNDNITVSIGDTDLARYKAFITDFSSFQFDFVNLKRPIVYFVPDMKEFKAGLHTYRELDLKYEDAFGKLCLNGEQLVEEIVKLINNDFEIEHIYKERMEGFFYKVDNRKDKLYEALKQN